MAKSTDLIVNIITDASKAGAGIDEATGKFGKFGDTLGRLAGPATAVLGGIAVLGTTALNSASDLQQAAGGVEAVFGDSARQIEDWAAAAASSVGLSQAAYSTYAAQIGAQLKNAGVPMDAIAGKTDEMIRLGADLAATYGGTTEQAVSALGAAFRGEADSAEKYGLGLNATAVNAELAATGQENLSGEALTAAKAQAVMDIATRQAAGAIGMFASESDTLAGSQQTMNAQLENTAAALGEALLPIITPVVQALAEFAGWVQENAAVVVPLIAAIAGLAAGILILNVVMAANPIGLIIAAIAALVIGIITLWNTNEGFRNFFINAWKAVQTATAAVVKFFQDAWTNAVRTVTDIIKTLQAIFKSVFDAIMVPIKAVIDAFNNIVGAIRNVIDWIGRIKIPDVFGAIGDFVTGQSATLALTGTPIVGGSLAYSPAPVVSGVPAGAGPTINIYGGLDSADAIARKVSSVLTGRARRTGGITIPRSPR